MTAQGSILLLLLQLPHTVSAHQGRWPLGPKQDSKLTEFGDQALSELSLQGLDQRPFFIRQGWLMNMPPVPPVPAPCLLAGYRQGPLRTLGDVAELCVVSWNDRGFGFCHGFASPGFWGVQHKIDN